MDKKLDILATLLMPEDWIEWQWKVESSKWKVVSSKWKVESRKLKEKAKNKRIYNGLPLSQTVKNNASGDAVQFKAASWKTVISYQLSVVSKCKRVQKPNTFESSFLLLQFLCPCLSWYLTSAFVFPFNFPLTTFYCTLLFFTLCFFFCFCFSFLLSTFCLLLSTVLPARCRLPAVFAFSDICFCLSFQLSTYYFQLYFTVLYVFPFFLSTFHFPLSTFYLLLTTFYCTSCPPQATPYLSILITLESSRMLSVSLSSFPSIRTSKYTDTAMGKPKFATVA